MELVEVQPGRLYVPVDFDKNHNYYADAEGKSRYTGITTILNVLAKPALIGWAAKMAVEHILQNAPGCDEGEHYAVTDLLLDDAKKAHTKKKEDAAAHGTDAHALVEAYILACIQQNGGEPMLEDKQLGASTISQFITWANENVDHFLFAERRMCEPELHIAGTADFAYVGKDGRRYVGDFKTSSGIFGMEYFLQTAAYTLMAEAEGDEKYDGLVIVRHGKKGPTDFEVQYMYDYETARDAFLACLKLYRSEAAIKELVIK